MLDNFLNFLQVSCCRGNFSCFVILRACHHVLYDPSFQAFLGFPFVVCFSTFLPICLRAFWQTLTRKRERRQTLWLFFGDISLMHCTPAGKGKFLNDSQYLIWNNKFLLIINFPGFHIFFTF